MQRRKRRKSSTNNLQSETTEYIAHKMAIKYVYYEPPDNREGQIQWHERVEATKKRENLIEKTR